MENQIELVIPGRTRDLGGFSVKRILPFQSHRMVGPFVFFDHMGPAEFAPGTGLDVRPHPHINLATVTYLLEGRIIHRDSLGFEQAIEPGAINWMTAGHGITHSERSSPNDRAAGHKLHGIQCWVALPQEFEETEPSFVHHPAESLPAFSEQGVTIRLLVGKIFGKVSPVKTHSEILYLDAQIPAGKTLTVPAEGRDLAFYVIGGRVEISGSSVEPNSMVIGKSGSSLTILAEDKAQVIVLGGRPLSGDRIIWWNFVSSSRDRILRGISDWKEGRFPKIPSDNLEFIPLPNDPLPQGPAKP